MRLTHVVNDGCLVEPLDWLALQHGMVYCLLKTLLAQVVYPSKYFHWQRHRPVHLSVSTETMKHTFKHRTRYCHIHLACTSVRYERKIHVLYNCHSKKILCALFSLKYELYEVFYTEIFQIYGICYPSLRSTE